MISGYLNKMKIKGKSWRSGISKRNQLQAHNSREKESVLPSIVLPELSSRSASFQQVPFDTSHLPFPSFCDSNPPFSSLCSSNPPFPFSCISDWMLMISFVDTKLQGNNAHTPKRLYVSLHTG